MARQGHTAIYLGILIGVVAVSFSAVLIRLAEAPFLVVAAFRISLASLVVVPVAAARYRSDVTQSSRRQIVFLGASSLCLALHFGTWIASLSYTSVASSVVLVTSSPIIVAFVSHFLIKERVSRSVVEGIALAVVGSVVLGWGDLRSSSQEALGDVLAFSGAVFAAGYLLFGRQVRGSIPVVPYIAVVYSGAAVLLLTAMAIAGDTFLGYPAKTYAMLFLIGLVPQLLGHSSLNWALGYVSATVVAVSVMAEPVGATLLAWLILDEIPRITSVVGGALLLAGVYVALRRPAVSSVET